MRKRLPNVVALTIACVVMVPLACAEEGVASLQAHVHGLSELAIAMEGESLEIQFTSPAMNLVGFEHIASSAKDKLAIENAASMLRQHESLFVLAGNRCDHMKTSIDLASLIERDDHEQAHQQTSTEHKSDDGHAIEHEEHAPNDNHSDVVANYKYRCENVVELSEITVDLFEMFPGIHKITTVWIKPIQQGVVTLTPSQRIVEFR